MIFVTHDVDEAVLLGQKAVILEDGIIKTDTHNCLIQRPGSGQIFKYRQEILKTIMGD